MVINPSSLGMPVWPIAPVLLVPLSNHDGLHGEMRLLPLTMKAFVMAYAWFGAIPATVGTALASAVSQNPAARFCWMSPNVNPAGGLGDRVNVLAGLPVSTSTMSPGLFSRLPGSRSSYSVWVE